LRQQYITQQYIVQHSLDMNDIHIATT